MKKSISKLFSLYWFFLFAGIIFVVATIAFVFYTDFEFLGKTKTQEWGDYGSFVGGILSAFSTIYLVLAFNHQRELSAKEEIEKRFFLMLELYKKNVEELEIDNPSDTKSNSASGKKSINLIVEDFRVLYQYVKEFNKRSQPYSVDEQNKDLEFAYEQLYFGTSKTSAVALYETEGTIPDNALGIPADFLVKLNESATEQEKWAAYLYERITTNGQLDGNKYLLWLSSKWSGFDGYHNLLGHYFRHLYNTVSYINKQKILTQKEKYEYLKILRTQLTNNEQKLIFLNAFFRYGKVWEFEHREVTQMKSAVEKKERKKLLITNYRLIKNLPKGEVFPGISASSFFPDIDFESR